MGERCHRLRLALEPVQALLVSGEGLRKNLDRHLAVEPRVPRPVHLPHSPRAERGEDLVGT